MAAKKRKPAIQLSNDDRMMEPDPYPQDRIKIKTGSGSKTVYRKPQKKKIMQAKPYKKSMIIEMWDV